MCTPVDSALTTAATVAGREDNILSQSVLGELVSSVTCEECAWNQVPGFVCRICRPSKALQSVCEQKSC